MVSCYERIDFDAEKARLGLGSIVPDWHLKGLTPIGGEWIILSDTLALREFMPPEQSQLWGVSYYGVILDGPTESHFDIGGQTDYVHVKNGLGRIKMSPLEDPWNLQTLWLYPGKALKLPEDTIRTYRPYQNSLVLEILTCPAFEADREVGLSYFPRGLNASF
ncbi:MAG: hypothetical protein JW727_05770 [Candidatus Aenigmarchaeota archaeon]|nr:hypothetical protein [Candidatus Aenigmarchaeota archaeon]